MRPCLIALSATMFFSAPAQAADQSAAAEQAPGAASAARQTGALKLAQLVEPRDNLINPARMEAQFVQALISDADMKTLEDEHPGVIRALWRSAAAELEQQTIASMPRYWDNLAAVYSGGLTTEEIEAACAFFRSDVGQKLIKLKSDAMLGQFAKLLPEFLAGELGQKAYSASNMDAAKNAVSGLTQGEQLMLAAFGMSTAGQKLQTLTPQVQRVTVAWANESDPEDDARIEALMAKGLDDHLKASKAKKSRR